MLTAIWFPACNHLSCSTSNLKSQRISLRCCDQAAFWLPTPADGACATVGCPPLPHPVPLQVHRLAVGTGSASTSCPCFRTPQVCCVVFDAGSEQAHCDSHPCTSLQANSKTAGCLFGMILSDECWLLGWIGCWGWAHGGGIAQANSIWATSGCTPLATAWLGSTACRATT
jgi:hypothetical protein